VNSPSDQRFKPFLEKVFLSARVGTVWEDWENIGGKTLLKHFRKKVENSSALFLMLSRDAQAAIGSGVPAFWEPGFAQGRDIFIFKHCEDLKRVTTHIPDFTHYLALYITNAWKNYVERIVETFEDPGPKPVSFPEARLEAIDPSAMAVFFDEKTGMALFDHSNAGPIGKKVACPHCAASYVLHRPDDMTMIQCPACDGFAEIK
jgi:hypothetical protein